MFWRIVSAMAAKGFPVVGRFGIALGVSKGRRIMGK
jgi:hypothetical protein